MTFAPIDIGDDRAMDITYSESREGQSAPIAATVAAPTIEPIDAPVRLTKIPVEAGTYVHLDDVVTWISEYGRNITREPEIAASVGGNIALVENLFRQASEEMRLRIG